MSSKTFFQTYISVLILCFICVSDSLSVPMYMYQACLEPLYQAVRPLESMKPWSSETMTSLAILGKVCVLLVHNTNT